jgi:hypothetical protein
LDVESTKKKTRNERTKLDLCQGREMKSSKRSSLFANNPTIPDIDEYVKRRISLIKKTNLFYCRKNVETANEEVFGTASSMDTMTVHPHIVSASRLEY